MTAHRRPTGGGWTSRVIALARIVRMIRMPAKSSTKLRP
jgi:hypothetical protein